MSFESRIITLAQAIGCDVKNIILNQGDLSTLETTNKSSLVAALNEVFLLGGGGGSGASINDSAGDGSTTVTWSANKIFDELQAAKQAVKSDLTGGADAALDTLAELAAALNNDPSFAATLATEVSYRVRFDAPQVMSAAEKLQACTNLGVGNPEHDFVADYQAAKV